MPLKLSGRHVACFNHWSKVEQAPCCRFQSLVQSTRTYAPPPPTPSPHTHGVFRRVYPSGSKRHSVVTEIIRCIKPTNNNNKSDTPVKSHKINPLYRSAGQFRRLHPGPSRTTWTCYSNFQIVCEKATAWTGSVFNIADCSPHPDQHMDLRICIYKHICICKSMDQHSSVANRYPCTSRSAAVRQNHLPAQPKSFSHATADSTAVYINKPAGSVGDALDQTHQSVNSDFAICQRRETDSQSSPYSQNCTRPFCKSGLPKQKYAQCHDRRNC